MKLFIKLLLLLVVVAISGPYFIKGPDGQPLWSLQDTANTVTATLRRWRANPVAAAVTPGASAVEVFRWQDADGQWHFTNVAPNDTPHSVLRIDPRTNAVGMVIERSQASEAEADPDIAADQPNTHIGPLPDPETARRLIEDARALQALADERAAAMQNID